MNKLLPLLALALLLPGGCKTKDPTPQPPASPLDQLPPATQTGQGTFGCLVNGQAWTPAGNPFGGPLLSVVYLKQRFGISANRGTVNNGVSSFQRIGMSAKGISTPGIYMLNDSSSRVGSHENFDNSCSAYTSASNVGSLEITRLDLAARIVSGRFSFTLETPGCGTVTVTDGRFDSRF
jgi:hypothetical protein